jgi:hypothetical protein
VIEILHKSKINRKALINERWRGLAWSVVFGWGSARGTPSLGSLRMLTRSHGFLTSAFLDFSNDNLESDLKTKILVRFWCPVMGSVDFAMFNHQKKNKSGKIVVQR